MRVRPSREREGEVTLRIVLTIKHFETSPPSLEEMVRTEFADRLSMANGPVSRSSVWIMHLGVYDRRVQEGVSWERFGRPQTAVVPQIQDSYRNHRQAQVAEQASGEGDLRAGGQYTSQVPSERQGFWRLKRRRGDPNGGG